MRYDAHELLNLGVAFYLYITVQVVPIDQNS